MRRRLSVLLGVLVLALGALLARVAQLQAIEGPRLQALAHRQQVATIPLEPHRGRILDRRGRPLAVNLRATSVYAVPTAIRNRAAFARAVGPVLGLPPREIRARLLGGRHFVWLARKVDADVVDRLTSLKLHGQLGFLTETRRAYPAGALAAHALGFVGIDNQGLSGVELSHDKVLRGAAGRAVAEQDGVGRLLVETQQLVRAPVDGSDILLTIDQVIQHIAERELSTAMTKSAARRGSVTVMDPRTGEILALAVRPTYDPNTAGTVPAERWLPRPLADVYEPGSTFKVFVTAAALDAGVMGAADHVFCAGSLRVPGNHVIRDAHGRKHGWQTMGAVLKNSCNVGAAQIGTRLGKSRMFEYIRRFGFGDPTGIDLPGESRGIVPNPSAWLGPGLQTISFGQGVGTTALQLLTATTALANEGTMLRPHIVRAVRDSEGRLVNAVGTDPIRQVVQPHVARAVLQMMTGTVAEGTGEQAAIEGYTVAGKTGTAQKPSPHGGYDPSRYIASFLGIVPAERPRLLILVVLDEPRGMYFGGTVAAPVFREVASQALWYLRIPPAETRKPSATRRP
ncbi:MAG TPA: penicillin-binding transpeptidase domain-containing protein [bacterium]|nr:penicillin-binding transpeptidase domain-containing protein [bacterium]